MIRTMLSELTFDGLEDAALDLGIETQQYIELFAVFVTRIGDSIEELKDLLAEKKIESALRCIHSTKGTAQNMRLDMIAQPAILVENMLKNDKLEEAIEAQEKLKGAFELLLKQAKTEGVWKQD